MRKKLICLLVAGALPGLAMADATSDQIKALQQQLNALQKEVKQLKSELATKPAAKTTAGAAMAAPAVAAAAAPAQEVDISSPDYGKAQAHLSNDEVDAMKQQIANQQLKVDSLFDAANTGPLAGLSITGYLDPTYIYNRAPGTSSFLFANHTGAYNYFNSTFGDLYLDIKKTFGVGPMAPSAEITLMPNRGNGITLLQNEHGEIGDNILNTAVISVPLTATTTLQAGLMSSYGGYEVQQSNQMVTLTHNLLYDFSDPGSYVGVAMNYSPDGSNWAWKFMVGNEQYRTNGAQTQIGTNALGDPITTSNKIPTFTARGDYTWSSALDRWFVQRWSSDAVVGAAHRRDGRADSGRHRLRSGRPGAEFGRLLRVRRSRCDLHARGQPVQRRTRLRPTAARRVQRRQCAVVRLLAARAPQVQRAGGRPHGRGRHVTTCSPTARTAAAVGASCSTATAWIRQTASASMRIASPTRRTMASSALARRVRT